MMQKDFLLIVAVITSGFYTISCQEKSKPKHQSLGQIYYSINNPQQNHGLGLQNREYKYDPNLFHEQTQYYHGEVYDPSYDQMFYETEEKAPLSEGVLPFLWRAGEKATERLIRRRRGHHGGLRRQDEPGFSFMGASVSYREAGEAFLGTILETIAFIITDVWFSINWP